ncbi:hypothetical protein [Clostridium sardiniense]|uniref:hypothetical protein n=1 Tax=Clostridium sardiniense TaxID=29369 RepID=UPI001958CCD1|nr:hypothetical protein [Clostridium sardiniense]MBM7834533.1 hypothetical protein [Clostridium sardiniense]
MAKPSIFSKDYEKKMKRRRLRIIIIVGLVAIIAGLLIYKFKIENMDFSNVRNKLQAWVDSDNPDIKKPVEESKVPEVKEPEVKPEPPKKTYIEAKLDGDIVAKCEYKIVDDKKEFVGMEKIEGASYDISPNKQLLLILDKDQNIKLVDIDGKVTDITRKEYVSTKGDKFPKDTIIKKDKGYVWHNQAKFIDDDNIAYGSNLPYFGTAANKEYLWIYNIKSKNNTLVRSISGKDITIGKVVPKKGIEVKVDKNEYIINNKGSIVK